MYLYIYMFLFIGTFKNILDKFGGMAFPLQCPHLEFFRKHLTITMFFGLLLYFD